MEFDLDHTTPVAAMPPNPAPSGPLARTSVAGRVAARASHPVGQLATIVAAALLIGVAALAGPTIAADGTSAGTSNPRAAIDDRPATDPRVDAARDRITELPEATQPERIIQPLPAFHRIAESDDEIAMDAAATAVARSLMREGIDHLIDRQRSDGSWMAGVVTFPTDQPDRPTPISVAVTALAIKAIAQSVPEGHALPERDAAALDRAVQHLHRWRTDDSTWGAGPLASYVNACVVMGLAATRDHRLREIVDDGVEFLRTAQWDESEGISPRQDWYGGAGYGRHGRPDLSNTQLMLDAFHDAGVSADDPAVQRALAFVTRTQNLRATNPAEWAQAGADDGGFVYTPANGGESFASEARGEGRHGEIRPEGTPRSLRSYGSMTYAGLKSLLYAGLDADDERVVAALGWIARHLTFDENPGLGEQGLYYYWHAMARALVAAQQKTIVPTTDDPEATDGPDASGVNWRGELVSAIAARRQPDGGWRNPTTRWLEGEEDLATIYALLALQECLKPAP